MLIKGALLMKNKIIWLRIAYWSGAIVDGLAAILLTFPDLNAWFSGATLINGFPIFRSVNAQAAALMWGWTLLLLWADRQPLERRGVLVLTLFPVLTLLIGSRIQEMLVYQASLLRNLPLFGLQLSLVTLFIYSLWMNRSSRGSSTLKKGAIRGC
jgi:hypothetical protein